jgi:hypothetical protein
LKGMGGLIVKAVRILPIGGVSFALPVNPIGIYRTILWF